ncbi:MAG: B12-binding domain-containing radical SAM protein [Victivallales bacterium]|nr:B12-binding domain-containing radical SAM protein [Victivallales bacterium]
MLALPENQERLRFRVIAPAYPAFNIYSGFACHTTALGPVLVATAVGRMTGWDAEVIDENNYRRFGPRGEDRLPDHGILQRIRAADIVGLYGGLSSTIPRLYELARIYKEQGITTIAGGQHFVSENLRDALEHGIDYVVCGEGEHTTRELLVSLREGRVPDDVPGLAFLRDGELVVTPERPPITDFSDLPFPDFSLVRYAKIKVYPLNWTRGCGMDCEFCTVKGRPRPTSPERMVEQVAALVETHNARFFFIVDDLFGQRRQDALRLCHLLTEYQHAIGTRLGITVQIRLDHARDTELLQAMRQASITTVCIGFESPIPEELAAMNKRVKPEEMLAMTKLYHQAGFLVHGMFIFGYPLPPDAVLNLSVRQRVRQFRRFIRRGRIDTIQILLPVPLPGTELTERLAAQHRIFPREVIGWEYYDGNFPLFQPDPPLTPEQMHAALRKIMGRFYRFRHMFGVALNVLIFPAMIFSVFNLRFGWRHWHRSWRNALIRFGGWIVFRNWSHALRKGGFSEKLRQVCPEQDTPEQQPPATQKGLGSGA